MPIYLSGVILIVEMIHIKLVGDCKLYRKRCYLYIVFLVSLDLDKIEKEFMCSRMVLE